MSRSPDVDADGAEEPVLERYRNGWTALSQLIGKGRSFSGHERNCCFLNTGRDAADHRRFADISAAAGLDQIDDGRALALADWDADGDLDLWVSNRTAPRVRFLRNDTRGENHWLSLRLQGVTCNRDAIGARVEVVLKGRAPRRRFTKTLHAGDGYLAQSTKWVHFGLGSASEIERVDVRWPGGEKESFAGVTADRRYRLVQGSGRAETMPRRDLEPLVASPVTPAPVSAAGMRTVIVGRVPLPESTYQSWTGENLSLDRHRGRPTLVTLWSRTCAPCVRELTEWTREKQRLRSAGLEVLALCVDAMTAETRNDTSSRELIERLEFPFLSGRALPGLIDNLEVTHRTYVELQQPLPVPSSFLLDGQGCVGAIYKGRVSLDRLLADVKLLEATPAERRASAVPFAGRWASEPFPADPRPLAHTLAMRDEAAAKAYLERCAGVSGGSSRPARSAAVIAALGRGEQFLSQGKLDDAASAYAELLELAPGDGELHRQVGQQLLTRGRLQDATRHFALAIQREPRNARLLYNYGLAELGLRRTRTAIELFRRALEQQPDDVTTHFQLASALHAEGETRAAISHLRRALALRPGWPHAANRLAWILATNADDSVRGGEEAVMLAEAMCRRDRYRNPVLLSTLAAAYAEVGRYEDAVRVNQRAVELARGAGQESIAERFARRQKLYLAGRPFRDQPR